MKLLTMVTDSKSDVRNLRAIGEPTGVPRRSPSRGPVLAQRRLVPKSAEAEVA